MITADNYFVEVERIGINNLPETLKRSHEFVLKSTNNGSSWDAVNSNETIKKVFNLYLSKLNEFVSSIKEKKPHGEQPAKAAKPYPKPSGKARAPEKRASQKKARLKIEKSSAKKVEHIREEIKFIKRFVGLQKKVKSPNAILSFIKALQRAIVQKLIRKTSPVAKEIEMIQERLIQTYSRMKGDETFLINEKDLNKLVVIAGGEEVYPSITVIKRFVGMQGKQMEDKKINSFITYMENLVKKGKISKEDPYADKVNQIYRKLKTRTSRTISISNAELNGLEGIVKTCGCKKDLGKIYNTKGRKLRQCKKKTYSDASRGACSHNKGLSGVLTAEEMANRQLDLLAFSSFWLSLFGKPARNFTMMFHGEPHNGKTIFLLILAQYLAENFGEVLYVSSEEFASPTMTKKVNEFLNPIPKRLHFAENLKDPDLSQYNFIILDSVNDLALKINEYKKIRKDHPATAFIFILQHTKAGDFRGGKDWEHMAEIVGEVSQGVVTITKNRYAPKNTLNFFEQFGIQWKEQENQSLLKPYPVNGMITQDNQHY